MPDPTPEPPFEPSAPPVLALVRDLLLSSRITMTARQTGVPVKVLRDPASLTTATESPLLLVDLNLDHALEAAAEWGAGRPDRRVIGFVSHVDADPIRRAREAGLSEILARGKFFETLEKLLGTISRR